LATHSAELGFRVATIPTPCGGSFAIACREKFARPDGQEYDDPLMRAYLTGCLGTLGPLVPLARSILRPGQRVLDVGAHVGGFSLLAASLGCRVAAIEASPWNVDLLRRSVELNEFRDCQLLNVAAADRPGELEFASMGPWGQVSCEGIDRPTVRVDAVRIDDLLQDLGWDNVEFIKLDVEGYEVRAVRGMARLLSRADAPPVYFESNSFTLNMYGETPATLFETFRGLGYELTGWDANFAPFAVPDEGFQQTEVVADFLARKPNR
jgi:FkbM family methyltransferase